ncbi:Uncharacterised protein [Mycobacteroides abscessus subsp. abscessus]|nr:Uncharacterised protein [Mycobacteroides abscessus subsp. abscessus]
MVREYDCGAISLGSALAGTASRNPSMATMKLVATSRAITDITMPKTPHGVNSPRPNQSDANTDRQLVARPGTTSGGATCETSLLQP